MMSPKVYLAAKKQKKESFIYSVVNINTDRLSLSVTVYRGKEKMEKCAGKCEGKRYRIKPILLTSAEWHLIWEDLHMLSFVG